MISSLSQQFLEFIERIWFRTYWLAAALLDNAKNTRQLIDFVLADVNMLFNAVNWAAFEVGVRIQHPTRVDHQIDRNRLKN